MHACMANNVATFRGVAEKRRLTKRRIRNSLDGQPGTEESYSNRRKIHLENIPPGEKRERRGRVEIELSLLQHRSEFKDICPLCNAVYRCGQRSTARARKERAAFSPITKEPNTIHPISRFGADTTVEKCEQTFRLLDIISDGDKAKKMGKLAMGR